MSRKGDAVISAVGPFLPWLLGGTVLYFFGGRILTALGAKITGTSVEEYAADVSTVGAALSTPIDTASDIFTFVTGIAAQADQGPIEVPYPNPQSQAEYRANIDAISAVLAQRKAEAAAAH